ncbi:MAG: DUF5615 family PIN-like protein [Phycisphaeraceae bacterium]|nr:DUF5615 family PIN-like protein [Phycisphaeraceae bacterium]
MRLLLDECVPRTLLPHLTGLAAEHLRDLGWKGLANGDLLNAMREAGFTVLLTVDRNLRFQQPITEYGVSVVLLASVGNTVECLLPLLPQLRRELPFIQAGQLVQIDTPGV